MDAVLNLGKNGLQDWLLQRISALVLAIYTIFLVTYLVMHPSLSYGEWQLLFSGNWVRFFSSIALLSLIIHAWIGLWTVITDYVKPMPLRLATQVIFILILLGCFFWGIQSLWGINYASA